MRPHDLEQALSENLGTEIIVVRTKEEIDPTRLHQGERNRLSDLRFEKRRRDWLLGRKALKEILLTLGENSDTMGVTYPGSRVSLTHAGQIAYAAATPEKDHGIGIDYEPFRDLDTRVARWFLTDEESEWFNVRPETDRSSELVRLWTVKEAAFKCHPDNGRLSFRDISINEPSGNVCVAAAAGRRIKIAIEACGSGYLSVAICGEKQ